MSAKTQHNNILYAIIGFAAVVAIVALIGFFALGRDPEIIQGQVEVSEYRVSSKVPGRILEIRVKEGDYVKVGDTLAILDAPEVRAKMEQAQSAENAAAALELKAQNGAREEQIRGAYNLLQQAKAGLEIAEKSYQRIQRFLTRVSSVLRNAMKYMPATRPWRLSAKPPKASMTWPATVRVVKTKWPLQPKWGVPEVLCRR
jgi:multidrug efflux pump subunit AcrA (membrane-fusion protein)